MKKQVIIVHISQIKSLNKNNPKCSLTFYDANNFYMSKAYKHVQNVPIYRSKKQSNSQLVYALYEDKRYYFRLNRWINNEYMFVEFIEPDNLFYKILWKILRISSRKIEIIKC